MCLVKLEKIGYCVVMHSEKPKIILKNISYVIKLGETHLISGPSGSGKTTFLQLVATFIQPTKGKLQLFGKEVYPSSNNGDIDFIRSKIGYLYQTPYLPEHLKVKDYLEVQALLSGIGTQTAKDRVTKLLKQFDLLDFAGCYPKTLSGGEKQRLAIVGVLAKEVDLILLDEPAGSLDFENKQLLVEMIEQLGDHSKTVIIVSHDDSFQKIANKKYHLKDKTLLSE